jgi:hypothetical protein
VTRTPSPTLADATAITTTLTVTATSVPAVIGTATPVTTAIPLTPTVTRQHAHHHGNCDDDADDSNGDRPRDCHDDCCHLANSGGKNGHTDRVRDDPTADPSSDCDGNALVVTEGHIHCCEHAYCGGHQRGRSPSGSDTSARNGHKHRNGGHRRRCCSDGDIDRDGHAAPYDYSDLYTDGDEYADASGNGDSDPSADCNGNRYTRVDGHSHRHSSTHRHGHHHADYDQHTDASTHDDCNRNHCVHGDRHPYAYTSPDGYRHGHRYADQDEYRNGTANGYPDPGADRYHRTDGDTDTDTCPGPHAHLNCYGHPCGDTHHCPAAFTNSNQSTGGEHDRVDSARAIHNHAFSKGDRNVYGHIIQPE